MGIWLNIAGSACMIVFLLLLVWRGLWELEWLPKAVAYPFAVRKEDTSRAMSNAFHQKKGVPCTLSEGVFWFLTAIGMSWFFLWIGFQCSGVQDYNEFLPYVWTRLTTVGDALHYQYIAENSYARAGDKMNLIVFYPLYPLCMSLVRILFGGNTLLAGVVFSECCWGLSAVALRRLAGRLYAPTTAQVAPLAMILFPFSFFSLGVFTESLFLLCTILTLDAMVRKDFVQVGVFGCLSTLCRTQGFVLVIAAVYVFLMAYRGKGALQAWRKALPILLIPMGYLVYLMLNWYYCGNPLAFLHYQSIEPWYQTADWIGNNLAQQWGMAVAYPGLAKFIYLPEIALYFVGMMLLLYGVLAKAPVPILLYGGAYLGASYLSNWLISGSRYVFGCVAFYLIVAHIKNQKAQLLILVLETGFLAYYATCFMQGQAIM